jgi:hypothetical protein
MFDPSDDLIYIYTGLPAEEYFDFVDAELVSLELSAFEPTLDCTISIRAGPPVDLDKTVWYTLMFDENNNASDNCMDYPWNDIDTMYTVVYAPTELSIERAIYDGFWIVEDTEAWYGAASSLPGGFSVDIHVPLAELPELTETLPWKVKTEIHDGFPDLGDLVPDENLACLEPKPDIVVSNLVHGEIVTNPTQTLTGYVKDPEVTEIHYNVMSILHEDSGTVPVLDGNFSFDINLAEGYNVVTISDGTNEQPMILKLDTSPPLVSFIAEPCFTGVDFLNIFYGSLNAFPEPPFGYDMQDEKEEHFTEGANKGLLKSQDRNYYKNGVKKGDVHIEWEYYDTGPAKGKPKKKTTTYTDENGNPVKTLGGGTTEYTYDEKGTLETEKYIPYDPKHYTREYKYKYDAGGKLIERDETLKVGEKVEGITHETYEYPAPGKRRITIRDLDPKGEQIGEPRVIEEEYENGKLKKRSHTVKAGLTMTFTTTYEYDEKGRLIKEITEEKILEFPEAEIEKTTKTYEYTDKKVKVTTTTNPTTKTIQVSEYRYESDFPDFAEPTYFSGRLMISDISYNPMLPYFGVSTVMISIVNSTGSFSDVYWMTGNFLDYNMTLSMNTTVTMTVLDEAGHVGVNTIHIPLPLISDLDCNRKVNILDITIVATAFGSKLGDERWDFFADVNNDRVVNIVDIALVAKDYGKTT